MDPETITESGKKNRPLQIAVISGKGGTGKTSVTASIAALCSNAVLADCDVDAADLHLVTSPEKIFEEKFISGNEAVIDPEKCTGCGKCFFLCRFGAVKRDEESGKFRMDPTSCEGCGVCFDNCPASAIEFPQRCCGDWMVSETRFGTMVHAALKPGAENSGKLVTLVRNRGLEIAEEKGAELLIIDGPPGIGCPVIASITGTDYIIAVTEPTLSGRHDLDRVLDLATHFGIKVFVCVNKWDINPEITADIEKIATEKGAEVSGRISWDSSVTQAQIDGKSVAEIKNSIAAKEIDELWKRLRQRIL